MRRNNKHDSRSALGSLPDYSIRRERGEVIITINIGSLVIIIRVPP